MNVVERTEGKERKQNERKVKERKGKAVRQEVEVRGHWKERGRGIRRERKEGWGR